ncbi:MAG: 16S rRNA (guanine(527)-N(7))-methyltransferase RsmG [Bacteroidales bacterium]|nr:16S rRNA (guanine(527)-N(7))-methyltransferase RsmG [Bacteroidales bacterium]
MKHIYHYFPDLTKLQYSQFEALGTLYPEWNEKVNVISRKDIENLYVHHILHSMAIAKYFSFKQNSSVLDIGTGGGFPGIPLAILFPRVSFTLIDSIAKKIMVVETIAKEIGLKNVTTQQIRVENLHEKFDYVVSRAVTSFPEFFKMSKKNVSGIVNNKLQNGIIYLKGGDFFEEMKGFRKYKIYSINDCFIEPFFETKKIIYLPIVP